MAGYTVAIVGRPNVGKSTLFNRFIEQRKAIVDDFSGVTRDRQYGLCEWNGKIFNVIDTGGFVAGSNDVFESEIRKQVKIAIDEADLIIFLVDATTGNTDLDDAVDKMLRSTNKPVLLAVNKVDNASRQMDAMEFYVYGREHTYFLSSTSGSGTGELLDAVTDNIIDWQEVEEEFEWEDFENEFGEIQQIKVPKKGLPKIAIIGQPNAGKSTLLNALIGEERSIVSDIAGTTRDTIHTRYKMYGKEFELIDTAGLRKKKNVNEDLEFYSVIRAIKAMDEADICMLLIDAEKGLTAQDVNIYSLAARKGKGIVLLVNKWDTIADKETNTARDYEKELKKKLAPFNDVPILFVSAQEKQRIFQAVEAALKVYDNRFKRLQTATLNEIMLKEVEAFKPPVSRGYMVRIKFVMQLPTASTAFAFYSNHPNDIKQPYKNFLENKLRQHFDFSGVPIKIFIRKK